MSKSKVKLIAHFNDGTAKFKIGLNIYEYMTGDNYKLISLMDKYKFRPASLLNAVKKIAKYINKNFGDKVTATAYKTNNEWCNTANVEIVPINKVKYPHREYRDYIMKNGGSGIPHYYDTKEFKVYKKMKKDLVEILCCPTCKEDLDLKIDEEEKGEIITVTFTCKKCKCTYTIEDGIPNLLPK